jgi:hypothetical protein
MDRDRLSIQMTRAEVEAKTKKGVSFYLHNDKAYTFIETTPAQRFQIKCAITPRKRPLVERLAETLDNLDAFVDILQVF